MNKIPAFPQTDLSAYGMGPAETGNSGMSLRDWFAGQALAGIAAYKNDNVFYRTEEDSARWAYRYADAMMEARNEDN